MIHRTRCPPIWRIATVARTRLLLIEHPDVSPRNVMLAYQDTFQHVSVLVRFQEPADITIVSRGQTAIFLQGVMAFSISAVKFKGAYNVTIPL